MIRRRAQEFARFLGVGAVTTVLSLSIIFALKSLLGTGDVAANATGYAIGLAFNFRLNGRWTFSSSGAGWSRFPGFLGTSAIAYAANLAAVLIFIRVLHVNSYLSHVLGVPFYTLTSYILSRRFVFRPPAL